MKIKSLYEVEPTSTIMDCFITLSEMKTRAIVTMSLAGLALVFAGVLFRHGEYAEAILSSLVSLVLFILGRRYKKIYSDLHCFCVKELNKRHEQIIDYIEDIVSNVKGVEIDVEDLMTAVDPIHPIFGVPRSQLKNRREQDSFSDGPEE